MSSDCFSDSFVCVESAFLRDAISSSCCFVRVFSVVSSSLREMFSRRKLAVICATLSDPDTGFLLSLASRASCRLTPVKASVIVSGSLAARLSAMRFERSLLMPLLSSSACFLYCSGLELLRRTPDGELVRMDSSAPSEGSKTLAPLSPMLETAKREL